MQENVQRFKGCECEVTVYDEDGSTHTAVIYLLLVWVWFQIKKSCFIWGVKVSAKGEWAEVQGYSKTVNLLMN